MKKDIHPEYRHDIKVTCACGEEFITGSTLPENIRVEICSKCHPWFTGTKRIVDTEGRVVKFMRRVESAQKAKKTKPTQD